MKYDYIIGYDPGGTTGWCVLPVDDARGLTAGQLAPDEVAPALEVWLALTSAEQPGVRVLIAVERYVVTSRTARLSQQPDALKITGQIEAIANRYLNVEVTSQLAAPPKLFAPDRKLKQWGVDRPGKRHARDAIRQAIMALAAVEGIFLDEGVQPPDSC